MHANIEKESFVVVAVSKILRSMDIDTLMLDMI